MKKLVFGPLFLLPLALAIPASALPGISHHPLIRDTIVNTDINEITGGGRGRCLGLGRGHRNRAFGWSKGSKVGWRGGGCPPGLGKQGRCG